MEDEAARQHTVFLEVLSTVAAAVCGGSEDEKQTSSEAAHVEYVNNTNGIKGKDNRSGSVNLTDQEKFAICFNAKNIEDASKQIYNTTTTKVKLFKMQNHTRKLEEHFSIPISVNYNPSPTLRFLSCVPDIVIEEIPVTDLKPRRAFWVGKKHMTIDLNAKDIKVLSEDITATKFYTCLRFFHLKKFFIVNTIVFFITTYHNPTVYRGMFKGLYELLQYGKLLSPKNENSAGRIVEVTAKALDTGGPSLSCEKDYKAVAEVLNSETGKHLTLSGDASSTVTVARQVVSGKKSGKKGRRLGLSYLCTKSATPNSEVLKTEMDGIQSVARSGRVRKLKPELMDYINTLRESVATPVDTDSTKDLTYADPEDRESTKRKRGRPYKHVQPEEDEPKVKIKLFTKAKGSGRQRKTESQSHEEILILQPRRPPGRPRKLGTHLHKKSLKPSKGAIAASEAGGTNPEEEAPIGNASNKSDMLDTAAVKSEEIAESVDSDCPEEKCGEKRESEGKAAQWLDSSGRVLVTIKQYFDLALARTKRTFCSTCITNLHQVNTKQKCPFYNPKIIVDNPDEGVSNVKMRSVESLPDQLCFVKNKLTNKMVVHTFEKLQPLTQFGPLAGILLTEDTLPQDADLADLWFLSYEEQGDRHFLYCGEAENSNWCRYIQESPPKEANMIAVLKPDGIFFVTTRTIEPREPLKVHVPFYGNKERPFVHDFDIPECIVCNVRFSDMIGFQKHYHIHHPYGMKNQKVACGECGIILHNRKMLRKHSQEEHDGKGGMQCPQCDRIFYYHSKLKIHMSTKHPDPTAAANCSKCGKEFKSEHAVNIHILKAHSTTSVSCPTCGKSFPYRASLLRHQRNIHEKRFKHFCSHCGRGFNDSWALKNHEASHDKNRLYICQECHTTFTSRYLVRQHLAKVHGLMKVALPSDPNDNEVQETDEVAFVGGMHQEDEASTSVFTITPAAEEITVTDTHVTIPHTIEEVTAGDEAVTSETTAADEIESKDVPAGGRNVTTNGTDSTVEARELYENELAVETIFVEVLDGQHIAGDKQIIMTQEGQQVQILNTDDIGLQYTVEIDNSEWTV